MKSKKRSKKSSKSGAPNKLTIVINDDGTLDPKDAQVSRNGAQSKADWVRWHNQADRGVTLTFTEWPFIEAKAPIAVNKGKKSPWFHIYVDTDVTDYDYTMEPELRVGAPTEPKIEVTG